MTLTPEERTRRRQEAGREAAAKRWSHDNAGLDGRIEDLARRWPALTEVQRARLQTLLTDWRSNDD